MHECIKVIEGHSSVREYLEEDMPEAHLNTILEAARRAPSGWNLQPITVIVVRRPEVKARLAEALGGQEHVAKASIFLVFAIDYAKIVKAGEELGYRVEPGLGNLVEALIDAGIASGWAAIAAESLGYGITFIAIYENPCKVAEILGMPDYTIPVVGLTIGKPAEKPPLRPRQNIEAFADYEHYSTPSVKARGVISSLDTYAGRAAKLFSYIFQPGGYYERASKNTAECLSKKKFKLF